MTVERKWAALFDQAACAGRDPALFFIPLGEDGKPTVHGNTWFKKARDICAGCPVRDLCNDYSVENGLQDGFYGGVASFRLRADAYRERHGHGTPPGVNQPGGIRLPYRQIVRLTATQARR